MRFLIAVLAAALTPVGWLLRGRRAGGQHSVRHAPELAAPATIELVTPAFTDGGAIPDRHASMDLGPNISPELRWRGVPRGTAQLLLIIEDVDAPFARPSLHTVALLPPDGHGLAEGALTSDSPSVRYVPARRGRTGYVGPRPFPGHGTHRYGFHLYALDRELPTDPRRRAWLGCCRSCAVTCSPRACLRAPGAADRPAPGATGRRTGRCPQA